MSRGGEDIRSSFQFIQNGRVIVCLLVGGRPGCPYQGLEVSRSLPRVINSFWLLKSATNRSKSSSDNVNALLLLESFQFVFEKLNVIVRLRVTENKKYILTSLIIYLLFIFGPQSRKIPNRLYARAKQAVLGRITILPNKTGSRSRKGPRPC